MDLADTFFDLADMLESRRLYRFADQTRGVGISMTNNIAEGAGSDSNREFSRYLRISRSSVFEGANISFVLYRRKLIDEAHHASLLESCDHLARMISNFRSSLLKQ